MAPRRHVILALVTTLGLVLGATAQAEVADDAVDSNPTQPPAPERSDADRIGGYVFDGLVLRPTGAAMVVLGSVIAIPSYPLSMISGHQQTVLERCVLDQYEYTVTRPLGDF